MCWQTPARRAEERAFARALATETLRWQGALDAVLARFLQNPLPESAVHARVLLRMGAAQLLVMGAPAHAAVGETVETANGMREARGFAKLMNAVLRRVAREGEAILHGLPEGVHLPGWLFTRWRAAYGADTAAAMAMATLNQAPLDLSVKADPEGWAEKLGGLVTPTGSVRLKEYERVETLPGFEQGAWWVQDAVAALPAKLVNMAARAPTAPRWAANMQLPPPAHTSPQR